MHTAALDSGDMFMNLHHPVSGTCSRLWHTVIDGPTYGECCSNFYFKGVGGGWWLGPLKNFHRVHITGFTSYFLQFTLDMSISYT